METGDELETQRKLYDEGVYDEKVRQNEVDDVRILMSAILYDHSFPSLQTRD